MDKSLDTIMTFTARSPGRIIREGGSQAWKINLREAKQCEFLLCTQNAHNSDEVFEDANQPHGSAFLVGRISEFRRPDEGNDEKRWMIAISEYALVSIPDVWDHKRYPVRYVSLAQVGIDPATLDWRPMPPPDEAGEEGAAAASSPVSPVPTMLIIKQAKIRLAASLNVKPEAIDITVRY